MELTRSEIKKHLNDAFKKTNYYKEIRNSKNLVAQNVNINDLDFVDILKEFYLQVKNNFNNLVSNGNWKASDRQNYLIELIDNLNNDILNINNLQLKDINVLDDLYWQIYDYFDDYGNKNELVYVEEMNIILTKLETLLNNLEK